MTSWCKKLRSVIWPLRHQWKHRCLPSDDDSESCHSRCSTLLDLPLDILWLIVPLLPLPSQVCLALSCKSLFQHFSFVLTDGRLAWPRLLAARTYKVSGKQPDLPRTQLLLQLEDDRWLYCSYCLKIHPRREFPVHEHNMPPLLRFCTYWAGVIDLCPCLALTIYDGVRLQQWLSIGMTNLYLHRNIRQAFQILFSDGRPYLLHHCSMANHADAFVKLVMKVTLDKENCLVVQTRYHVRWRKPRILPATDVDVLYYDYARPLAMEPIFVCPHFDILAFISDPFLWSQNECTLCDTIAYFVSCTGDGRYCVVQGIRNLGSQQDPAATRWRNSAQQDFHKHRRRWYLFHGDDP